MRRTLPREIGAPDGRIFSAMADVIAEFGRRRAEDNELKRDFRQLPGQRPADLIARGMLRRRLLST